MRRDILLVEDSQHDAELIVQALESIGLSGRIVIARDGEQARNLLQRQHNSAEAELVTPILILLDLKLPKISGLELLKIIRADAELSRIPIVALTSSRETRDVEQAYQLGVNAFVVKPIDFEDLTKAIRSLGSFWTSINEPPPMLPR
jgi:CheY-like chemotaxis protein